MEIAIVASLLAKGNVDINSGHGYKVNINRIGDYYSSDFEF
ncbi:hypothetical protein [Pseudopedobacter sp.]